jgi:hypothetical protein
MSVLLLHRVSMAALLIRTLLAAAWFDLAAQRERLN